MDSASKILIFWITGFWTIFFSERDLLDDGSNTTAARKQIIISNMVYGLALQWFGDYVTPYWWSNVWLKEALAHYFQYIIPDHVSNCSEII